MLVPCPQNFEAVRHGFFCLTSDRKENDELFTMSFDRGHLPRIRFTLVMAFVLMIVVSAPADDTWHNVYHSLRKFFTGKSGPTPTVHHRVRRSLDHDKADHSMEPTPSPAESSPRPESSATPRVVILPATSPTTPNPEAKPGAENSAKAPEAVVKPSPAPELGPVLRSLSEPSPTSSPAVPPNPSAASGNSTD